MPERQAGSAFAGAQVLADQPASADPGSLRIGVIGAGFSARDIHLAADAEAADPVVAIAWRPPAQQVAAAPILAETGVA